MDVIWGLHFGSQFGHSITSVALPPLDKEPKPLKEVAQARDHCIDVGRPFLVVGPAMDVKLASMEAGYFGGAFARQFVPVVVGVAVAVASLVGWWLL